MGIESEHSGQAALAGRGFHRACDHRLVAGVDAIENAEREMQRDAKRGQVFKAVSNQHPSGIALRRCLFKALDGGSAATKNAAENLATVRRMAIKTGEFRNFRFLHWHRRGLRAVFPSCPLSRISPLTASLS
jgi:hypothetical protein